MKYPSVYSTPNGQVYAAAKGNFTDRHKVSLGMEYAPDPQSLKWSNRVRYRLGISYSTPYIKVDGNDGPHDFLASMGIGLPITNFHNNRSFINFSAQYERVKPKLAGMVTENYFRFCIGLSFNERWFMKWKAE